MHGWLTRRVLAFQLRRLLQRPCGAQIPRSGERGEAVDCFSTFLQTGEVPGIVLTHSEGDEFFGLEFDGSRYANPVTLMLEDIVPARLNVIRYYGLDEIEYRGLVSLVVGEISKWPYVFVFVRKSFRRATQQLFNRRRLEISQRLEVLQDVVDMAENGDDAVDALDILTKRYGYRWVDHPQRESHLREIRLNLSYLADTGELKRDNSNYRATGFALKTLQDAAEDDRRHRANLRVQRLLAALTLVSALMAIAQAGLIRFSPIVDFVSKAGPDSKK